VSTFISRAAGRRVLLLAGLVFGVLGCQHAPIDLSEGPAPWRIPRPGPDAETYEDSLTGGEVFAMYCNQCHNARALGERPFANYQNVAAHMRVRANFTGEEYEKLMAFLRRWHDVPQPTPPVEPSPKRLIPPQPIAELRDEIAPQAQPAAGAQPAAAGAQPGGAADAPAAAEQPPLLQPEPLPMPARPAAGR
jgi:hypothetical protein